MVRNLTPSHKAHWTVVRFHWSTVCNIEFSASEKAPSCWCCVASANHSYQHSVVFWKQIILYCKISHPFLCSCPVMLEHSQAPVKMMQEDAQPDLTLCTKIPIHICNPKQYMSSSSDTFCCQCQSNENVWQRCDLGNGFLNVTGLRLSDIFFFFYLPPTSGSHTSCWGWIPSSGSFSEDLSLGLVYRFNVKSHSLCQPGCCAGSCPSN